MTTLQPTIVYKDPDAKLDYTFDWSEWLESDDSISTAAWTVPEGLTKTADSFDNQTVTIWLSGGSDWTDYHVICEVETTNGRIDQRKLLVCVRER